MKKLIVIPLLLAALSSFAEAPRYRVAVLDFVMETTRENHRLVGKGLTELFAFELGSDESIVIIDRNARNSALEEIEFSLTGLADDESLLDVGEFLTANFLVTGKLVEMGNRYLISVRLFSVETGEPVWQDQLLTTLRNYNSITRYFSESLLAKLVGASITEPPPSESSEIEIDDAEEPVALIAFSTAMDAIDSGDKRLAREELGKVRSADPTARVVDYYLSLLAVVSPRFKFDLKPFGPTYNPAYLPQNDADKFFLWSSMPFDFLTRSPGDRLVTADLSVYENDGVISAGYLMPIADRHGLDISISWSSSISEINTSVPYTYGAGSQSSFINDFYNWSVGLNYGLKFNSRVSIGVGFQPILAQRLVSLTPTDDMSFRFALTAGSLVTFFDQRLFWDFQIVYSQVPEYYADESDQTFYVGRKPISIETSAIGAIVPETLYASLKGLFDIYVDNRGGFFTELVPMVEYRPIRFLAIKAGYRLSMLFQSSKSAVGHGVNAGLTFSLRKWEITTAFSYASSPVTSAAGYIAPQTKFHIGLTRSGNFLGE